MRELFVVWSAGFAIHLAMFARSLSRAGIPTTIHARSVLYATGALLVIAIAWPALFLTVAVRYFGRTRE